LPTAASDLASLSQVGDRCEVEPGAKRGTVKFVGRAEALGVDSGLECNMMSHLESTMACMFIAKPLKRTLC
jgi:hypothetical protein